MYSHLMYVVINVVHQLNVTTQLNRKANNKCLNRFNSKSYTDYLSAVRECGLSVKHKYHMLIEFTSV